MRLFWIIGALFIGVVISLYLYQRFDLASLLIEPAKPYLKDGQLMLTNPADGFTVVFSLCFWIGIVLASPVIIYQIWGFVVPALYPNEKRVGVYVLGGGLLLFLAGASLAFFYVLPATLKFFQLFAGKSFQPLYTAREYFSLLVTLLLTFGIAFELPIVIVGLTALGLVTPGFLRNYRRHAFVLCVIGAAMCTPGDAVTATFALIVPLYFLYELGILLSVRVHAWRERRENSIGDSTAEPGEAQGSA